MRSNPGQVLATENRLYRKRTLRPESDEVITRALQTDAVARRIMAKGFELTHGDLIGVRINMLTVTRVDVHTFMKSRPLAVSNICIHCMYFDDRIHINKGIPD